MEEHAKHITKEMGGEEDDCSLVVNTKERDVVKDLKKNLLPEELGVQINTLKSTLNGHVCLRIAETTPGAKQEMLSKIRDTVKTAKRATVSQQSKRMVIMDIDCDIGLKEILESTSKVQPTEKHETRKPNGYTALFPPRAAADKAIAMRNALGTKLDNNGDNRMDKRP